MLYCVEGALAQLGERYNGIVEVRGSIPLGSTKVKLKTIFGNNFAYLQTKIRIILELQNKYEGPI